MKSQETYTEYLKSKLLAELEKLDLQLPKFSGEFNAGVGYAKGELIKCLKSIKL